MRVRAAVLVLTAWVAMSAPVQADVFAVATPFYATAAQGYGEVGDAAVQWVAEALRRSGHEVVRATELDAPNSDLLARPCPDASCGEAVRVAARAAAAVAVRVQSTVPHTAPDQLVISLIVDEAVVYQESCALGEESRAAFAQAWRRVYDAYRRGPGPWVRVTGSPRGASVWVDGERVGGVPVLLQVAPGRHDISVGSAGSEPVWHTVQLATAQMFELSVALGSSE